MSEAKKSDTAFLLQGSILAMASLISRVVGLVYRIPLTAIIGKTGNDYYGTAYEIYNIILIISSYSIPLAVSKLVSARMARHQYKNASKVLKGSLVFACISGGIAALLVFVFADVFTGWLRTPFSAIALRVLSPVLFIVAIVGVLRGFFQGLNTMVPSAMSQIAEQIVNAVVSVVAAYSLFAFGVKTGEVLNNPECFGAAYGAAGGTAGTAAGALCALIFMFFVFMVYRKKLKKRVVKDHSNHEETYGNIIKVLLITIIPVLLSTTLYNISAIIDQYIFKNMVAAQGYGPRQISEWWGVFIGQYIVLINVPISISSAIAASSVPSLTSSKGAEDDKRTRRQISLANRFVLIVGLPCTVGFFVLAQPIMMMLFNDTDPVSGMMMRVGAIAILFYSVSTLSNGILQGIDRMHIPVRNAAISLILQAVLLVILLKQFNLNIYAVIIANAFYAFAMCVLNQMAVKKYSGATIDIGLAFIRPGISAIIMGVAVFVVYYLMNLVTHSNIISTIVSIVVGAFLYFVILILMKGITEMEMMRLPKGQAMVKLAKKIGIM